MSFLERLFGGSKTQSSSNQTPARQEPAAAPPVPTPKPVPAKAASQSASPVFSSASTVSPSEFPTRAAWSHTNSVVPISEIADLIRSLATALTSKGMSKDTMQDLWFFSLIGLCPKCGTPCGPDALKMFVVFKAMRGGNVMFTGQSGGGDRLFRGQCRNTACSSRDMQIFWCPDIDPDAVAYFKSRGLELEDCSSKREGVWPLSDKKTSTAKELPKAGLGAQPTLLQAPSVATQQSGDTTDSARDTASAAQNQEAP